MADSHDGRAHPEAPTGADLHQPIPREEHEMTYWEKRTLALQTLLVEKGILKLDEIRRAIEDWEAITPALGARIVARAWADPDYKARLLEDAKAASRELGVDPGTTELIALENTDRLHHVVVCTLCSCYPRAILGQPPDWYKSTAYRTRTIAQPRAVLKEFGLELDQDVEVRVVDSTADVRYLVVPQRPAGTEHLGEDELAALVTRDSMIGTGQPRSPAAVEAR
jgi:nitrile hydratase subunit alpha